MVFWNPIHISSLQAKSTVTERDIKSLLQCLESRDSTSTTEDMSGTYWNKLVFSTCQSYKTHLQIYKKSQGHLPFSESD